MFYIWDENGTCYCHHDDGSVTTEKHELPEGFSVFECKPVRLLRDYPEENLKKGDQVMTELMPNTRLYLHNKENLVFETDAKLGVDFEMIQD